MITVNNVLCMPKIKLYLMSFYPRHFSTFIFVMTVKQIPVSDFVTFKALNHSK